MEFIFEEKQLNEISENKFPSKITRHTVRCYSVSTVQCKWVRCHSKENGAYGGHQLGQP